mgnify:CR=1 FL=1|jgi:hypothetical protein
MRRIISPSAIPGPKRAAVRLPSFQGGTAKTSRNGFRFQALIRSRETHASPERMRCASVERIKASDAGRHEMTFFRMSIPRVVLLHASHAYGPPEGRTGVPEVVSGGREWYDG